jgi:hypothetical protein
MKRDQNLFDQAEAESRADMNSNVFIYEWQIHKLEFTYK